LSKSIDEHGNVRKVVYNGAGDLSTVTIQKVELGVTRTTTRRYFYDIRGRLEKSEFLGSIATVQYDDRDLPVRQCEESGLTARVGYNCHGEITESVLDPDGLALQSQYEYDAAGAVRRYIDPTGQSTVWNRDALGCVAAMTLPDGSAWEYHAASQTRTHEQKMPSGNRLLVELFGQKQVTATFHAAPGNEPVSAYDFTYDGLGRLVQASTGTESVLRKYDSLDRLIEETAKGKTVSIEYDDLTGSSDVIFPDGRRERTEHNANDQPTRVVLVTPGELGGAAGEVLLEIVYSTAGRPLRMLYGNGVHSNWAYDDHDRIIRIDYVKGSSLLDSCRIRYDARGHRALTQSLGAPAQNVIGSFDARERLTETQSGFSLPPLADPASMVDQSADIGSAKATAAAAGAPRTIFTLDGSDTRTQITGLNGGGANVVYGSSKDHRVTQAGPNVISYNLDGQRTQDARYKYDLDALNRVRRVRDRSTGAILAELRYDALSRVSAGSTKGAQFERWFAGSTQIHEVSGALPELARQHSAHPLWPGPLCVTDASGRGYIHQDEGWSTTCVTDSAGVVLERHRYDSFGAGSAFTADGTTTLSSPKINPVWRGMPMLQGTALFVTPLRLYDPQLGGFTGPDPRLYTDSPSPYVYAGHNPADFADETGLAKSPLGRPDFSFGASPDTEEKSYWDTGGSTMATGAIGLTIGIVLLASNPVGWVIGLTAALALASGATGVLVGTTQMATSGSRNAREEANLNRSISAALGYASSPGSIVGGTIGMVAGNDQESFEKGSLIGGLAEAGGSMAYGAGSMALREYRFAKGYRGTTYNWKARPWGPQGVENPKPAILDAYGLGNAAERVRPNPLFYRGQEYIDLSHFVPQRWIRGFEPIFNRPWNITPMWATQHAMIDAYRYQMMLRTFKGVYGGQQLRGIELGLKMAPPWLLYVGYGVGRGSEEYLRP
jgi:RHS repeat-associated protein